MDALVPEKLQDPFRGSFPVRSIINHEINQGLNALRFAYLIAITSGYPSMDK